MTDRHDRIRGCLLGGAVGDALGAGIEFLSVAQIRQRWGSAGVVGFAPAYGRANAITDDTQMTLFTAAALLEQSAAQLADRLWRQYQGWSHHQRHGRTPGRAPDRGQGWVPVELERHASMRAVRAPGNACLSGLAAPQPGTLASPANPGSKGCGAVMRAAPFGLIATDPQQAWQDAITGSVLTHGHPSGYLSAAAFAWIICELLGGNPLAAAVTGALGRLENHGPDASETMTALRRGLELGTTAADLAPEDLERLGGGWTGEEALAIAVAAAATVGHFLAAGVSVEQAGRAALLLAVNHSGDSDSTGALCGNLLGAQYGTVVLPARWTREVEARKLVLAIATELADQFSDHEVA